MNTNKKSFWKIILTLSIIGLILVFAAAGLYIYQDRKAQEEYERLQRELAEQELTMEEIENMEFTGSRTVRRQSCRRISSLI